MSNPTNKMFWSEMEIEFELPADCVRDCHHVGQCDEDCEYWQKKLTLNLDRDQMERELNEYGIDGVKDKSHKELEMYCIWIASGNIQETEEWQKYEDSELKQL